MARKSAAALAIVPKAPGSAPPAPASLSATERALWGDIVASKPADWFGPDSLPVLTEYVRAVAMCDLLAERLRAILQGNGEGGQAAAAVDEAAVRVVLDMRDKESRRAVSLATKMRLTQQSRYGARDAERADRRAGGKRPWQTGN